MMRFYEKLPYMECLTGDTLPEFTVNVTGAESLGECRMQVILSRHGDPSAAVLRKECTAVAGGFRVQLTSTDTALPEHEYDMHFRLIDGSGLSYRKLAGTLYVRSAAG